MSNKKYLNEEKYQHTKNKISTIALLILIIGILLGICLISIGIVNNRKINLEYSDENKNNLTIKINDELVKLETRKTDLENKGITYDEFANYDDGETYELKIITKALDPSFDYCKFDEYQNNITTSTYCNLKNQQEDLNSDFDKTFATSKNIPYFMFGAFIIIASCMISGSVYMMTKRRELLAFSMQQVMPVAKEGIETIAPTMSKVGKEVMEEMAPAYGEMAKEIAKGIKEGIKEEK